MPVKSTKSTASASPGRTAARKRPTSPGRRTRTATAPTHPGHGEIAERAYFIHLEEGHGDELQNWLRAERELMAA